MMLAETIRSARERQGLTQAQLAARAGCSRMTVIAIEGGQSARQRTLEAVAAALGMRLDITTPAFANEGAAIDGENAAPRHFTGRLTLKEMMMVARIERATGRRVYD
ncbi:helix-turn-helix transcriptional regulator [Acidiferrobacter sp.]|uniref:helix-turn-helix transcriptional regulator n=1 Tax=Acidiferrobacter sp. TaxID=1872107 RepID=UPI00261F00D6|nr:helix-turn-helix transcriptional regulator [Acidiferrobacter sp.]